MPVNHQIRNVVILLGIAILGIVAGFLVGVLWATDQMAGASSLQAAQALRAADKMLKQQAQQLQDANEQISTLAAQLNSLQTDSKTPAPRATTAPTPKPVAQTNSQSYYTGEDLMQAVNKYRREHGVPELQLHSGLCQLASLRLGELINLGDLDNHVGFENYFNEHEISDLSGQALTNVAENLASGYDTAWDAVMGWDSSPPHRRFLLADGSFKYGCGAANLGFAVLEGGF